MRLIASGAKLPSKVQFIGRISHLSPLDSVDDVSFRSYLVNKLIDLVGDIYSSCGCGQNWNSELELRRRGCNVDGAGGALELLSSQLQRKVKSD